MTPSPMRVILVDDVAGLRNLFRIVLEDSGRFLVVGEANDGIEGIEACRTHQPDVVLLDLSMPRMDGLEALPRILEVAPTAQVVVLSAFERDRMAARVLDLGAVAYMEKGADPLTFVENLSAVLIPAAPADAPGSEAAGATAGTARRSGTWGPDVSGEDAMVDSFFRAVSHELRTPLTPLITQLHLLMTGTLGPLGDRQHHALDVAARNTERLKSLVDDVLDAAQVRTPAGWVDVDSSALDLADVILEASKAAERVANRNGTVVKVDVAGSIDVVADPARLTQALQRIIEQCARWSRAEGTIPCVVTDEGSHVSIRIGFEGRELGPGDVSILFDPFAAIEALEPEVHPMHGSSTGLGLYLARAIIEAHAGSVVCHPAKLVPGGTFEIRLPPAAVHVQSRE